MLIRFPDGWNTRTGEKNELIRFPDGWNTRIGEKNEERRLTRISGLRNWKMKLTFTEIREDTRIQL